jgi:hypothetical protein
MTARPAQNVRQPENEWRAAQRTLSARRAVLLVTYARLALEDTMNYITLVRGTLKAADPAEAQATHDAIVAKLAGLTRPLGAVGHQAHLSPQNPSQFLAIDTWSNLDGLQTFMSDPAVAAELSQMFAGQPDVTVWAEADWAGFKQ